MKTILINLLTLSFISLMVFISCNKLCSVTPLTLEQRALNQPNLKTEGVYFHSQKKDMAFYLFQNGVIRTACLDEFKTTPQERFRCSEALEKSGRDVPYFWGIFIVKNDSISIEKWQPSDCKNDTRIYLGKIINDSTISISGFINPLSVERDTYRFVASVKPDSTNNFIK